MLKKFDIKLSNGLQNIWDNVVDKKTFKKYIDKNEHELIISSENFISKIDIIDNNFNIEKEQIYSELKTLNIILNTSLEAQDKDQI